MSPVAYRLYTYLRDKPEGQNIPMEMLETEVRASKSAIRAAFEELSQEGLLSYEQGG